MRTTSSLSVTGPVIRTVSSPTLAWGGGWLVVIFGASVSPRGTAATGGGGGVTRGGAGAGIATGGGPAGGAGSGRSGAGGGDATTGGAGGRAVPASSQLRPLRLPSAFTNRCTSGAYQRK